MILQQWLNRLRIWLLPHDPQSLLTLLETQHTLPKDHLKMLEGVITMDQQKVRDIMIPRAQMIALAKDQNVQEALSVIAKSKHSRFPVVAQDRDDFPGLILAKDLLTADAHDPLAHCIRPLACVPESMPISRLLRHFQKHHTHLAIVADEFGSISGLVTLEDIIEEIIGEIEDEHYDDPESIKTIDAHTHLIQAQTPIDLINKTLQLDLPTRDFDTLGGLVASHAGRIPRKGQCIQIGHYRCIVEQADARKTDWIKLEQVT